VISLPLVIELDGLPELQSHRCRTHWARRHRHDRQWKRDVAWIARSWRLPEPFEFAHVTCTRFSERAPDADNLVASFKPLIDGLVAARVLVDDDLQHVGVTYGWERAARGEGRVRIEVVPGVRA
jgi:hypothetical protein